MKAPTARGMVAAQWIASVKGESAYGARGLDEGSGCNRAMQGCNRTVDPQIQSGAAVVE